MQPCNPDDPSVMTAEVFFYNEQSEFPNSATVEVFIESGDSALPELETDAIRTAIDFLKSATALL
jgi:hypothetical protein